MAAYRADIEIAVRGLRDLAAVQQKLQETSKQIDRINTVWQNAASAPKGINAFNAAVQKSYALLQEAQVGTEAETIAIQNYARAVTVANSVRDRQNKLIQDQIQLQQKIVPTANAGFGVQGPALPPAVRPDTRGREALGNAIVGGAFPLLFGQGVGASAGGALGGAVGGLAGGVYGMGLSLVGTALGAQFDAAITSAKDFSASLKEGGDAATYLKERLGSLNPRIAEQIRNLQQSGQTAAAARLAMQELGRQIGKENADAFKRLGDNVSDAGNGFKVFSTVIIAGAARAAEGLDPLIKRFGTLASIIPGLAPAGVISNLRNLFGALGSLGRGTSQQPQQAETPEARQRTKELQSQYAISQQQLKLTTLSFETDSAAYVIARRRTAELELQAAKQKVAYDYARGTLSIKQKELELSIAQNTYQNQLNAIERERLNYIQQRAQKMQQQEEEAQRRAKQAAEEQRQALDRRANIQVQIINQAVQSLDIDTELRKLREGELPALQHRLSMQQNVLGLQQYALTTERERALINAKSVEEQRLLISLYDHKNSFLLRDNQLQTLILQKQIAQINNAKELAKIEQAKAIESAKLNNQAEQVAIMLNAATTRGDTRSRDFLQATQLRIQQATETLNIRTKRTQLEKELALLQGTEGTADKQLEVTRQLELLGIEERKLSIVQQMQLEQLRLNQAAERYGGIITAVENGLTKTFDLLIEGTDNWGESLRNIAATVLKDIAKQLLQIYVIEQLLGFVRKALLPATPSISGANLSSAGIPNLSFDTTSLSGFNLNLMEAYSIGARATGGPVGANQPYMVGERGPELFVPRSSGTIVPNNALAGSGSVSVVVNVDASGSAVQGNDQQSSQLGRLIGAQVRQVLITEKRPGGLLAATR